MSHVEKNKPSASQVCVSPLTAPENLSALQTLLKLLSASCGPEAMLQMARNASGGHITVSSDCRRLLAAISFSREILKVVVSSVTGHLSVHGDGGKFFVCSCLRLVLSTVDCFQAESRSFRVQCALYEIFIKILSEYLDSDQCRVTVKTDSLNLHVLLAFTRSVLRTRPLFNLSESDCDSLSELLVQCFVESLPEQTNTCSGEATVQSCHSDRVFFVGSPHEHPRNSRMLKGLLLECPALSTIDGELSLNLTRAAGSNQAMGGTGHDSGDDSSIKVVLVTCSMSGDLEEIVSATFEVTEGQASNVEKAVLEKWSTLCKHLASEGVGLLLCQKVIHPQLKVLLKALDIMAVDRLGSGPVAYIRDVTGAQPIVSVVSATNAGSLLGRVTAVKHVMLDDRSYLHLQQPASSLVTLILCSKTEEGLEEFKSCVKTSLRGLYSLLGDSKLLAGAGCWQMHCSLMLHEKVKKCLPTLAEQVGCTQAQVLSALSVFRASVFHNWVRLLHRGHGSHAKEEATLAFDRVIGHSWKAMDREEKSTCCCGLQISLSSHTTSITENPLFRSLSLLEHSSSIETDSLLSVCDIEHADKPAGQTSVNSSSFKVRPVTRSCVLDHFSAYTQALYKAVFTANLILSMGNIISD